MEAGAASAGASMFASFANEPKNRFSQHQAAGVIPRRGAFLGTMPGSDVRTSPEALVQRQIDAYNQHDADTFAAAYAEDLRLYDLGGELYLFGREALRERYAQVFRDAPQIEG